jgi:hypothetical protein
MDNVSVDQVRQFRLHTHHLDTWYQKTDVASVAGACGFQNSPPGAWEIALHNRIRDFKQDDMKKMLEVEKMLLQAWSIRGAPLVFPVSESNTFLSALVANQEESWIYTRGIQLALDFIEMPFEVLLKMLKQVIPKLDSKVLISKATLDQTLADWMLLLLPNDKRALWNNPSMYGNPKTQTVGGAVVSFLLRPCSFMGLLVFGKREGISPTFTSFCNWIGHPLEIEGNPGQKLVRKYLHCYGPASIDGFMAWLGCSSAQAERTWQTVVNEIEPVYLAGKKLYLRSDDKELLLSPPQSNRKVHLLGGHDPYLGMQDRDVILDNKVKQNQIWQTVANPGAVLWQGKISGMWRSKKRGNGLDIEVTLWDDVNMLKANIQDLSDEHALFQQLKLNRITFFE